MLEQYTINSKIPQSPPFSKGETDFSPLGKRGVREILLNLNYCVCITLDLIKENKR
jgi:hypothetical protein